MLENFTDEDEGIVALRNPQMTAVRRVEIITGCNAVARQMNSDNG